MSSLAEGSGTAASKLITEAARRLGAHIERLTDDVVMCSHHGRNIAFYGMTGPTSGRFGRTLCRDRSALERYLSSRQIPFTLESEPAATHDIAVVNGEVVAIQHELDPGFREAATSLATRAVASVPGIAYATVTIEVHESSRLGVRAIDPSLRIWASSNPATSGRDVAAAVVESELAATSRVSLSSVRKTCW